MPDYETKVIGTSLGQCIKDILLKNVKIDDVVIIYANTAINRLEHLDSVIDTYSKDRWAGHNVHVCRAVIEYFLFRGIIQQERIGNGIVYGSYPDSNQTWYKFNELTDNFKKMYAGIKKNPNYGIRASRPEMQHGAETLQENKQLDRWKLLAGIN